MYTFYNKPNLGNLEEEWKALERIKSRVWKEAFQKGRESGFAAGFAAAQQQPQAKIEAAYEQGKADAAKLVPVRPLLRKNGVGY